MYVNAAQPKRQQERPTLTASPLCKAETACLPATGVADGCTCLGLAEPCRRLAEPTVFEMQAVKIYQYPAGLEKDIGIP